MKGDSGESPETMEDGYLIKQDQIERAFATAGVPMIPIFFLNPLTDSPQEIWQGFCSQITALRQRGVDRLARLTGSASNLINDCDTEKTRQARQNVSSAIEALAGRTVPLPAVVRPAHKNVIDQISLGHQSSIAAAMNRKGVWLNFPIRHMVGVGVRNDVVLRTQDLFVRIDEQLAGLADKYGTLSDVVEMIDAIRDDVTDWRQEFLTRALAIGETIFVPYLDDAGDLWEACAHRWGQGPGYKGDISRMLEEWFEGNSELSQARDDLDAALNAAWEEVIIERLTSATHWEDDEE